MRKLFITVLLVIAMISTGCLLDKGVQEQLLTEKSIVANSANLVSISSLSDLSTLPLIRNQEQIYVQGYWSENDGGGGVFVYDPESTAKPDGGMVLAAGDGKGRWHRVVDKDQPINVKWYGVRSDVEECQADRIQKALDYFANLKQSGTVYFPAGSYYINEQLRFQAGVNVTGDGMGRTILWSNQSGRYLVGNPTGGQDFRNATISNLTLQNPQRLLLMTVRNIRFYQVEFVGGIVRFENSSHITIDRSIFRDNLGKSAYASDVCSYVTLTNNTIINPEEGGINLSRHEHSYVANNVIISDHKINSGYGGIRLPNNAYNNVVENNTITRTGRGIFVLSGSTNNIIRNNTVSETTFQGIFVQSSNNTIEYNYIVDIGDESIYVVDDGSSKANNNLIRNNTINDTKYHPGGNRFIGLKVYGSGNQVLNNRVSREYGRAFKDISSGNTDQGNQYVNRI